MNWIFKKSDIYKLEWTGYTILFISSINIFFLLDLLAFNKTDLT